MLHESLRLEHVDELADGCLGDIENAPS